MATTTRTADDTATTLFPRHRFTVDEYYKLAEAGILTENDRVELIEGDIVEMTPIGIRHAVTVDRGNDALRTALGGRARVRVQNPIHLADDTEPQPDLTVCAPREYADSHPTPADIFVLVEIADSEVRRDRAKLLVYARASVRELWLVDLTTDTIEVHREPAPDGYRLVRRVLRGETLTVEAFPDVHIPVTEILR